MEHTVKTFVVQYYPYWKTSVSCSQTTEIQGMANWLQNWLKHNDKLICFSVSQSHGDVSDSDGEPNRFSV